MLATSEIELSQQALATNIKYLRSIVGPNVRISSVVKGNAYGHGIAQFVPMAERAGLDHFSVFSADEAFAVWQAVTGKSQIMIMGYIDNDDLEWAIDHEIEFFVFDMDRLIHSRDSAVRLKRKARIHLELETGLNRTGFDALQLEQVTAFLLENMDCFEIVGVCTHYAGAESVANYLRVKHQIKTFNKRVSWLKERGITPQVRHTACSAAAISYPHSRMDMVRIGILQYGFWPSKETFIDCMKYAANREDPLKRVIKWMSKVMDVKEVDTGEFIGYGTTFLVTEPMKIATVPVGYSQGYARSLSNQGRVLIHGDRFGVIGMVNMNLLIVDVTDHPEIQKGDEVVLIGDQGTLSISVASFSELSNQLNYEMLSRLPGYIPRTVVKQT